jgi:hypothetical protein
LRIVDSIIVNIEIIDSFILRACGIGGSEVNSDYIIGEGGICKANIAIEIAKTYA